MIDRRQLLYGTTLVLGSCRGRSIAPVDGGLCEASVTSTGPRVEPLHPDQLPRFVDPLPIPAVARPEGTRPDPGAPGRELPYYRVAMREGMTKVHRDVPPTRIWGYGGTFPGPTFEVRAGEGMLVEWVNELPDRHFLPVDHNICGAGKDQHEARAVVHVHGARVAPESDGFPEDALPPGRSALFHYPNGQEAATLWYHDHTMGTERLNQYAGLFGAFLVRDEVEDTLNLPSGPYEVPLMQSERLFDENGQLVYPTSGNPQAPWVAEVYGDAMLVNGKLAPYLDVEPRRYRFRMLNASNARIYNLSLSSGQPIHQIGSDQGFLAAPVSLPVLVLAPAERADVLIDFSASAGQRVTLKTALLELLQFRVAPLPAGRKVTPASLPKALRPVSRMRASEAVKTRFLTLNQYHLPHTRTMMMLLAGARWEDPVTEKPAFGSTEIWELANATEDAHPIHLHLVRFQILERQAFDAERYLSRQVLKLNGDPEPPAPGEAGWKDTVRVDPGFVTRIIVKFDRYKGRYLWHCHILEHAANEMMRPFEIV